MEGGVVCRRVGGVNYSEYEWCVFVTRDRLRIAYGKRIGLLGFW